MCVYIYIYIYMYIYIYVREGNKCGGQAMSNKWTICKFQAGCPRAKVEGRRRPGRPGTKWLEEVNKNARGMEIRHDVGGQPHWIGMSGGSCLWSPGPLEELYHQR